MAQRKHIHYTIGYRDDSGQFRAFLEYPLYSSKEKALREAKKGNLIKRTEWKEYSPAIDEAIFEVY